MEGERERETDRENETGVIKREIGRKREGEKSIDE